MDFSLRISFLFLFLILAGCELGIRPVFTPSTENTCDANPAAFGGGSGTAIDPYKICTRAHLTAIAGVYQTKYFILKTDIDLGGSGNPWVPIASSVGSGFTGTYDGNNKTISNLYFTGSFAGGEAVGLFSYVSGGTIKNLTLTGVNITGSDGRVGGLVGLVDSASEIRNVYVSGSVSGTDRVGGIVGSFTNSSIYSSSCLVTVTSSGGNGGGLIGYAENTGNPTIIQDSHSAGSFSFPGASSNGGGLIGYATTVDISRSYSTVAVTAPIAGAQFLGGLIGNIDSTSTVQDSYATGNVSAVNAGEVGGLIGRAQDVSIDRSYATGSVTGDSMVGGLIGYDRSGNNIRNSYSRGAVTGTNIVGGLIGDTAANELRHCYSTGLVTSAGVAGGLIGSDSGAAESDNYWDTQSSGQVASPLGTGLTTAQMRDFNNFIAFDFVTIWNGAGFGGSAAVYPFLR